MKVILFGKIGDVVGKTAVLALIYGIMFYFRVLTIESKSVSIAVWAILTLAVGVSFWLVQITQNLWFWYKEKRTQ